MAHVQPSIERVLHPRYQPIVAKGTDIATDLLSTVINFSCILKTFSSDFKQESLLWVDFINLSLSHGEEGCVKAREIFVEKISMLELDGINPTKAVVKTTVIVAAARDGTSGIKAIVQKVPVIFTVMDTSRKTKPDAADSNI
ncbi:hypothetical protein HG530_012361 [Fusarium avenaceum]|nr:hypothetical protein HG530_012361 [Fusarium avenaceum]